MKMKIKRNLGPNFLSLISSSCKCQLNSMLYKISGEIEGRGSNQ